MNRAAVSMLVVAVALVGIAFGLMGGMLFAHHAASLRMPWGPPDGMHGPPPGGHPPLAQVLPRLARALDLTPEQVRRIEPKVIESQKQFEAARESLRSRIEAELTPAQRARWHELQRERDRERGRHLPFPGDPGADERHPDRPRAGDQGEPR